MLWKKKKKKKLSREHFEVLSMPLFALDGMLKIELKMKCTVCSVPNNFQAATEFPSQTVSQIFNVAGQLSHIGAMNFPWSADPEVT